MGLHTYVVARDYGFAPNPFYGTCTLGTCKWVIRKTAQIGDWIAGFGPKPKGRQDRLVFAMRVTGERTFNQYWDDPEFQAKKPNLFGSKKQAFGDNIYCRDPTSGLWQQLDSHHALDNGGPNQLNISDDTKADRVLISTDFVYWGGAGPKIPARFRNYDGQDICPGRGHKNRFSEALIQDFVDWLRSLGESGYRGMPLDWSRSA